MNDEKTAVINMISDGKITTSEGIELLEALYDLEDMGIYETDVEVEAPCYLPPWESDVQRPRELAWLLIEDKFAKAIALANQEVIAALRDGDLESIPLEISALDLGQVSRFGIMPKRGVPGAFIAGAFALKIEDNGIRQRNWGFLMARVVNEEQEQTPTWGEPVLMQIFTVPRFLRLRWEADEVVNEKREQVKAVSTVASFDDSVITKAGKFDDCLKLRIGISALEGYQFRIIKQGITHDINNDLRMIGTKFIWLAPNVGVVKLVYEHPDNMQTEIELVDYQVRGDELLYFPLSLGNKWQYQWQDKFGVHRELMRVVLKMEDEMLVSFANHMEEAAG